MRYAGKNKKGIVINPLPTLKQYFRSRKRNAPVSDFFVKIFKKNGGKVKCVKIA